MQSFDYMTPTRLIFGKGVVEKLPSVMRSSERESSSPMVAEASRKLAFTKRSWSC